MPGKIQSCTRKGEGQLRVTHTAFFFLRVKILVGKKEWELEKAPERQEGSQKGCPYM